MDEHPANSSNSNLPIYLKENIKLAEKLVNTNTAIVRK